MNATMLQSITAAFLVTEDGGAPPYLHTPLRAFAADDLSFPIENIDDIEFLED